MLVLDWDEDLSLGVPVVDRDHRRLIDLHNRVHLAGWGDQCPEAIRAAVDDLACHVMQHFGHEEMLMRLSGYPGYERHRRMHVAFAARVSEFQSLLRRDPTMFPVARFRDFLRGSMQSHILQDDLDMKPFVDALAETKAT